MIYHAYSAESTHTCITSNSCVGWVLLSPILTFDHKYTRIYTHTHTQIHKQVHTHIHTYTHTHMHTYTHSYIHTHTYTHTHTMSVFLAF